MAALVLSGCQTGPVQPPPQAAPVRPYTADAAPPGAAPGTCWGADATPAVVETVTTQVLLQPAQVGEGGEIRTPALYKTETQQRIVQPRREIVFETPCKALLTTEFVASLQRALEARGHYRGAANGKLDRATQSAIRSYQRTEGVNSAILSIAAARKLGLIAYPRDT